METPPPLLPAPDAIRHRYLNHEASIQAIGALYLLGCAIFTLVAIAGLLGYNRLEPGNPGPTFFTSSLLFAFAAAEGWIGWQLRKLNPRAKVPATVLAVLGLLAFPLGTLINAYILYLLLSAKGRYVFSPEYRAVITATPHIRYKMGVIVWVFIWLVVAVLVLGLIFALFFRR